MHIFFVCILLHATRRLTAAKMLLSLGAQSTFINVTKKSPFPSPTIKLKITTWKQESDKYHIFPFPFRKL